MNGALPPSSIEQEITRVEAWARRILPTSLDPVKESLRTLGSLRIAETKGPGAEVGTMFTTPGGAPASVRISPIASAVSGVSSAGLQTTLQPAARAGPIFRVSIAAGKFHGVTSSETPMGWCMTRIRFLFVGAMAT